MLQGLRRTAPHVVLFVRECYGSPTINMWSSDEGVTHLISQGEGGEQGDPLMIMLFVLRHTPL